MADVFISYARADREIASVFADTFAAQGWSVWWDPEITYGTQFDRVIEKEIHEAKCVVVLWSKRSVESQWVRSEASEANQRGILVPIRIEAGAKEPLEFRKVQTADLAGWDGEGKNPTFQRLARDIEGIIGSQVRTDEKRVQPLDALGQHGTASSHLEQARERGHRINHRYVEFMCRLTDAHFALQREREAEGLASLRDALALGRQCGFMNTHTLPPVDVANL